MITISSEIVRGWINRVLRIVVDQQLSESHRKEPSLLL